MNGWWNSTKHYITPFLVLLASDRTPDVDLTAIGIFAIILHPIFYLLTVSSASTESSSSSKHHERMIRKREIEIIYFYSCLTFYYWLTKFGKNKNEIFEKSFKNCGQKMAVNKLLNVIKSSVCINLSSESKFIYLIATALWIDEHKYWRHICCRYRFYHKRFMFFFFCLFLVLRLFLWRFTQWRFKTTFSRQFYNPRWWHNNARMFTWKTTEHYLYIFSFM